MNIEDTLKTFQSQFAELNDKVDASQFKQMLKCSEDFEIAENDTLPLDYFNILDKDQDGFISFQDFLGPFLGQLQPSIIRSLIENKFIDVSSLTKLRLIFNNVKMNNLCKTEDFKKEVEKEGNPALLNGWTYLLELLPQKEYIDELEFSVSLVKLERKLLQFANANPYLEGNKNLQEYILNLQEVDNSKSNRIDAQMSSSLPDSSIISGPSKIHCFIRDPEVTLKMFVDDMMQNQKWQSTTPEQIRTLMINMKECTELVCNKIKKLEQRLEIYESPEDEPQCPESPEPSVEQQTLDSETNLNIITELIQEGKTRKSKKLLSRKELQATEFLQMNYKIMSNELSALKEENFYLMEYKEKYEKLNEEIQNKAISSSTDQKQILLDFQEQNNRQFKLIEQLRMDLQRITKENDVYKRFTKSEKMNLNSDMLQKLIEKSEQQQIDLQNVQLRKVEIEKKLQEKKAEARGYVVEDAPSVSTLRVLYGGTTTQQKALEKSISKIESELEQNQALMQQKLQEMEAEGSKESTDQQKAVEAQPPKEETKTDDQKDEEVPTQQTEAEEEPKKNESIVQLMFDSYLLSQWPRNKNILAQISETAEVMRPKDYFTESQQETISQAANGVSDETDVLNDLQYTSREQGYRIYSKDQKASTFVLLTNLNIFLFDRKYRLQECIPVKDLQSAVLFRDEHSVIALHTYDKPDILLELETNRTEFLVNLISVFEKQELPRFKLYISNSFSIKEELNIKSIQCKTSSETEEMASQDSDQEDQKETNEPEEQLETSNSQPLQDQDISKQSMEQDQQENTNSQSMQDQEEPKESVDQDQQNEDEGDSQQVEQENNELSTSHIMQSSSVNEQQQKSYQEVKDQLIVKDKKFVDTVLNNIFIQCIKTGYLLKKTQRLFGDWTQKHAVLTNGGIIYFNLKKNGAYDSRKFFPLNDFLIKDVDEKAVKKKNAFKIIFNRQEVAKDLILATKTPEDKEEWINAFHHHQRQVYEARMTAFTNRLEELKSAK